MVKMSCDSVVILAAGDGSRLKSSVPKIFHKIGGLSLVDHVIKAARDIDPEKIIVVSKPSYSASDFEYGDFITLAQQNAPKGSGDAVKCALGKIDFANDGGVYVLYADIPLVSPEILLELSRISKNCDKTAVVVLAIDARGTDNLGKLEAAENGTIKGIIEAKDAQINVADRKFIPFCNAGLFIKKKILKKLIDEIKPSEVTGESYITEIVRLAYETGFICRYVEGDVQELSGANTREELAILEQNFQNKARKKHMNNGVTLVAPETVFFSHDTEIENDVVIHPYVVFMRNVCVMSGASIGPFCVVEGAKIMNNARVGPFARLREGSEIQNCATIGNFVEIKNSVIAEKTKVNHLSYVGDSSVGENTNIGAGAITCNYDGFKKHKTTIGKNVFVGSNSAIVAPIQICDNAIVAAGSVITKDVEDGALAIARENQQNIVGGADNFRKKSKNRNQ
jgi:bifunctional UDP-N-acetylglucosamine pyrophosphorylase/glucosamine-1-phosphate N-acetyltransferase